MSTENVSINTRNLNPAVITKERDASTYIPTFTNEVAAFVGHFEKGPINEPQFITDVLTFKHIFGRGTDLHCNDWYQVYNYLQYSTGIWVTRTASLNDYNASSLPDEIFLNSQEDFNEYSGSSSSIDFIARTSGAWGNLLKCSVIQKSDYDNNVVLYNEIHAQEIFSFFEDSYVGICVFRKNQIVETFYLLESEIQNINTESSYIYVLTNPDNIMSYYDSSIRILTGGISQFPTSENIEESYEIFESKENYEIDIIIGNDKHNQAAINTAESRKDCIAFIGMPVSFVEFIKVKYTEESNYQILYSPEGNPYVLSESKPSRIANTSKIDNYINTLSNSEFVHFTLNVKRQLDGFSNSLKFINLAGDCAGLKAQASTERPFIASAGLERGLIRNYESIFYTDKNLKERYYKLGLNYIENGVLMTQKTFMSSNSAFSRVNVRSLFNNLERETQKILRNYVFEDNTYQTRGNIARVLKQYLENIRLQGSIDAGRVEVHSKDNLITVDIYVKPKYTIEFIQMRMNNVGTASIKSAVL